MKSTNIDLATGEILSDATDATVVATDTKVTRFTSQYRHDKHRSKRFTTINNEESMTQQSDAMDHDINIIVKRYGGGMNGLPNVQEQPIYGDFSGEGFTYREMVEKIKAADDAFQEIPADIRGRFQNDPNRWMEFVNDPKNLDELRKMGLANPAPLPTPEPEPMRVRIVPEDPPAGK